MSWTYSDSLATPLDKVRFRIGDTDPNREILSNETISAILAEYNNAVLRTSVICVRGILALLTRDTNRSVMGVSGSVDQATVHYRDLLRDLIAEMNTESGLYPGAITIATHDNLDTQNGDTMVPPDFQQGQFDQTRSRGEGPDWDGC